MTATIWHRHDKTAVLKNEEGFFSYSKLPIFICHTICRCMKCESSSSRYVIDVRAKKLTQQCYAGKLTPWRRQYHGWNPFLTLFENKPKKSHFTTIGDFWSWERWNHHSMRYLFSGNLSLKSPLQILSLIDLRFDNYRQFSYMYCNCSSSVIFQAMNIRLFLNATSHREATWFSLNARSLSDDMRLCWEAF